MHKDFLKNFQVNGTALPDEIVNAILEEHNRALEAEGVSCILPNEEQRDVLMYAIYDCVKGGKPLETVREPMEKLLADLSKEGADYFILGCTELPVVAEELKLPGAFIDPTAELAKAAILFCGYELK